MSRFQVKSSLKCLFVGLLAVACGGPPEALPETPSPPLASQESELCSGLSVTSLTLSGASTYNGELGGNGTWSVSTYSNAIHIEYYVDGVKKAWEDRPGSSGNWYYSQNGLDCVYRHDFQVKAWPMVIDSNGARTTCASGSKTLYKQVGEDCTTHQPCAECHSTTGRVTGTAAGHCSREAVSGQDPMQLFKRIKAE